MKLAILSDTRLPTHPSFAGHGLGQIVYTVAKGLADCGHDVTLFAAPGSEFKAGKLLTAGDERDFVRFDLSGYDAIADNTHVHVTGFLPGLPAIQVSHDREHRPTANAVFPSKAHRTFHGFGTHNSRILHNGVQIKDMTGKRRGGYAAFLSSFWPNKQPTGAMEAARLAGIPLYMAGPTPPPPPPGSRYIGPLWGEDKFEFLYHADVLIHPASNECAPVTILEAQSVGTPVIVSVFGGAPENMKDGVTGYARADIESMAEALHDIGEINRDACRQWVQNNRSADSMVDAYEKLLAEVAAGTRW